MNKACQFMAQPSETHWMILKRILRYLKGTISYGLYFQQASDFSIHGYNDVDWASCLDDRKSTSGLCVFMGPNLISGSSTKQKIATISSVESEYKSLVSLSAEIVWIMSLLCEL